MLDMLFPPRCVLCDTAAGPLCSSCGASFRPPPEMPLPPGVDHLIALCDYEGAGRDLVLALKRANRRVAIPLVAGALATGVAPTVRLAGERSRPLAVTWAPTTAQRRRSRGYDQSELVARELARRLGAGCGRLLQRRSGALEGASRAQRVDGVRFVATVAVPPRVMVVDDVVTSGATMSAAAAALRAAGSTEVIAVALARARSRGDRTAGRQAS
ncbi:MAG: ComF family protein [Actinomycetia bacterium]|nr:ComF family protein [Actinomycetes bacterium]